MFFLTDFFKGLKPRFDDDIIDRLNYYYTPMIIIIFSLTLSAKQYVGQPIQCWVPAQFTGAWEQYTENYCFVQNTYFLPLTDPIPKEIELREEREIGYYQWVPFILALQAVLFYIPCLIWRLLNWQSGIAVRGIINMALDTKNLEAETRQKNVETCSAHIQDCLDLQRELQITGRFCGVLFYGKHYGSYVSGLYIFIKLLYIVNVVGQFFILNSFLGPNYNFWGFEILRDLAMGQEWQVSGHFPRVTMCDFEVRVLANLHRWTVQCVLMINMYNEKVYLFLWFWFFIVAIATVCSTFYWIVAQAVASQQEGFIKRYLLVQEEHQRAPIDKKQLNQFVRRTLRPDGVFLLRMVAGNAGDLVANDIVDAMWKRFKEGKPQPPALPQGLPPSAPPASKDKPFTPPMSIDDGFVEEIPGNKDEEKIPLKADTDD